MSASVAAGETAYEVRAFNTAAASENKIHDDAVARRFGFHGALVPGVEVYAYMAHVPVARWGRAWLEGGAAECRFLKPVYDGAVARVTLALLAVACVILATRYWRRPDRALVTLPGATLALTLVLLMAAHRWLRTPFAQQGAIYLIPLSVLTVAAAIFKRKNKTAQIAFLTFSALILIRYIALFPFGAYIEGRQFAGGRTLAKTLRENAGTAPVRVGASSAAEPVINYYRTRYRQGNWQRIERQPLTGTYDYYVLTADDAALVEQLHLHVLYRDTVLILAR